MAGLGFIGAVGGLGKGVAEAGETWATARREERLAELKQANELARDERTAQRQEQRDERLDKRQAERDERLYKQDLEKESRRREYDNAVENRKAQRDSELKAQEHQRTLERDAKKHENDLSIERFKAEAKRIENQQGSAAATGGDYVRLFQTAVSQPRSTARDKSMVEWLKEMGVSQAGIDAAIGAARSGDVAIPGLVDTSNPTGKPPRANGQDPAIRERTARVRGNSPADPSVQPKDLGQSNPGKIVRDRKTGETFIYRNGQYIPYSGGF